MKSQILEFLFLSLTEDQTNVSLRVLLHSEKYKELPRPNQKHCSA